MDEEKLDSAIARGHESTATSLRPVWWSALALATLSVGTFLLIAGMMRLFAAATAPIPTESKFRAENQLPAGAPALNVNLAAELQQVMAQQRAVLGELQWVDRSAGIARIPIDEAISIAAKNGLPKSFGNLPAEKDYSHEQQ